VERRRAAGLPTGPVSPAAPARPSGALEHSSTGSGGTTPPTTRALHVRGGPYRCLAVKPTLAADTAKLADRPAGGPTVMVITSGAPGPEETGLCRIDIHIHGTTRAAASGSTTHPPTHPPTPSRPGRRPSPKKAAMGPTSSSTITRADRPSVISRRPGRDATRPAVARQRHGMRTRSNLVGPHHHRPGQRPFSAVDAPARSGSPAPVRTGVTRCGGTSRDRPTAVSAGHATPAHTRPGRCLWRPPMMIVAVSADRIP
jgi:hypothetical protein